jgi:phage tail-like protein
VETEEVIEGGLNSHVHQLPGVTKHSNLTLKRGYVTKVSPLALWASQCVGSTFGSPLQLQTLTISLLDSKGLPLVVWTLFDTWPVKWEVGALDSTNSNAVLTQTLELSYSTITTIIATN